MASKGIGRVGARCTYCGDQYGETFDHVIPVSRQKVSRKLASYDKSEGVPSCFECNGLLGTKSYFTIGSRAAYLAAKLAKRYKNLLSMPDWSDDDIELLDGSLQISIKQSVLAARLARKRISNCELVAAISPSIDEIWRGIRDT